MSHPPSTWHVVPSETQQSKGQRIISRYAGLEALRGRHLASVIQLSCVDKCDCFDYLQAVGIGGHASLCHHRQSNINTRFFLAGFIEKLTADIAAKRLSDQCCGIKKKKNSKLTPTDFLFNNICSILTVHILRLESAVHFALMLGS